MKTSSGLHVSPASRHIQVLTGQRVDPVSASIVHTDLPKAVIGGRGGTGKLGILLEDAVSRRLIDGISSQLDLTPVEIVGSRLSFADLSDFDLLVVDEAMAQRIRATFNESREHAVDPAPALVTVLPKGAHPQGATPISQTVSDGILLLPEQPSVVVTQLSVILYAHRAYAQRFRSALDELQLNRRIFRSVTSGITVARASDPDVPLIYVNPAFEAVTGYAAEEAIGQNCRFLQACDNEQPGLETIRAAMREGREVTAVIRNYRKDGALFWNELSLSPIRNRYGEITHFVGIQNDVTARIEYENTLRESEKLATAGRLAATIAHEINNPLEAVTNLLYLARTSQDQAEIQQYVADAETELQRVAQLTSQSLKFYKQSTRPSAVHPAELLESILDLYHGRLDLGHIEVTARYRHSEPVTCLESEVRQVISNLIRNAIDSTQGMGGRLVIRNRSATDRRTGVRGALITIADTGCGMSEETKRRMYDAFYTTKGTHGTGLGLWVSAEIVIRHKGRLSVRSRETAPSGTVFALFLPYGAVLA